MSPLRCGGALLIRFCHRPTHAALDIDVFDISKQRARAAAVAAARKQQ
jgi:hypothetical protein